MKIVEFLEHSFLTQCTYSGEMSRLSFLSNYIFEFTTYDDQIGELFASKALEVVTAITEGTTFKYIEDADNYRWFLLMVNMPFFARRLDWGTSIRGAWWKYGDHTLESTGIWHDGRQVLLLKFSEEEWVCFTCALVAFAGAQS